MCVGPHDILKAGRRLGSYALRRCRYDTLPLTSYRIVKMASDGDNALGNVDTATPGIAAFCGTVTLMALPDPDVRQDYIPHLRRV